MKTNNVEHLNFTEEPRQRHPNDRKHKGDKLNPDHRTIETNNKD